MGGAAGKLLRQLPQVDPVAILERKLPDLMLFDVMRTAKAYRPPIRRFHRQPTVRVAADMRTVDRTLLAAWDGTLVAPHPRAMAWALA
jgi:hypothetical protein